MVVGVFLLIAGQYVLSYPGPLPNPIAEGEFLIVLGGIILLLGVYFLYRGGQKATEPKSPSR
jgi:hypothetical protein